jgi:peptidoglycan L-alanyl-D-glutamate endopeptidase CwlK
MASRDLRSLRPEFQGPARALLSRVSTALGPGVECIVTCTQRPREEQAALYALGRTKIGPKPHDMARCAFCASRLGHRVTNAKPGSTYHEYGLALDVMLFRFGKGIEAITDPAWVAFGKLVDEAELCWGGHWTQRDGPHVEQHPPGLDCMDAAKLGNPT